MHRSVVETLLNRRLHVLVGFLELGGPVRMSRSDAD